MPKICSERGGAHLHTNVLAQLLDWACLYQQSSPDLLDLQSIPGDAHGCLISLYLHQILHMVTSLLEALYFCLPCSHSQEGEKNRQTQFQSFLLRYQHILCLLENGKVSVHPVCAFWTMRCRGLGRCGWGETVSDPHLPPVAKTCP